MQDSRFQGKILFGIPSELYKIPAGVGPLIVIIFESLVLEGVHKRGRVCFTDRTKTLQTNTFTD